MTPQRIPLWAGGLLTWIVGAALLAAVLTPSDYGCDRGAIAGAIAWAGLRAMALIGGWSLVVTRRKRPPD